MQLNEKGLALLRNFEGFRARAYQDVGGVWTVGYGHTGRAHPPEVTQTTVMTEPEARALLVREAEDFASRIRPFISRTISDDQFSALVSFAYNVGVANFRKSSVLVAVNAGDDAGVARRLGLWVKAGGKSWPGLVRRRAAEAALYLGDATQAPAPEPPCGKPLVKSSTLWAAGLSLLAASGAQAAPVLAILIIALATVWIIRERWRKSHQEGV
jgi:lysozyme